MAKELDILRQTEYIPENLKGLQNDVKQAYLELIDDAENKRFWEAFRYTYDARRKRQFLDESDTRNGLAGALSYGMWGMYQESKQWVIDRNTQDGMFEPVDDEFQNSLRESASKLVEIPYYVNQFAFHLASSDKLTTTDKDAVKGIIKNGLQVYWENTYGAGFSGDPW